jgi:hypothetical protein
LRERFRKREEEHGGVREKELVLTADGVTIIGVVG